MTTPEENAKALGRLEGSLAALVLGVGDLKGDLIDRIDTESRQREQTAIAVKGTVERLERLVEFGLTTIRTDLTADINNLTGVVDGHEDRIVLLESERALRRWRSDFLHSLLRPWTALVWGTAGAGAAEVVHLLFFT